MRKIGLITGAILIWASASASYAAERLPADAVEVSFKEVIGDRFVGVIHTVMGTSTLQKVNATHYRFRIGKRGNQNDYAVFFAHLPYVDKVEPLPKLSAAEREMPPVVMQLPTSPSGAPRGFVPGQLLVKFKPDVKPGAIAQLNASNGVTLKDTIEGIDVSLLALPPNLSVDEARKRYMASGLVQYAEPNRTMSLPPQPGNDPVPADNGGSGIYLSPGQLLGTHLLVRYRANGPAPDLINQIYGTKTLERTDADELRLALPSSMNPLVAQRIFRLCPYVMQAEAANGR